MRASAPQIATPDGALTVDAAPATMTIVSELSLSIDDERVLGIARAVRDAGGRALLVGGVVRDALAAGAPPPLRDVDLEVYGIDGERLRALLGRFGPVNAVGAAFTVYRVGDIDVSIPRRDSKTGRGHRGFTVTGDPTMTVEEAARRRDFTVNAILADPLTGRGPRSRWAASPTSRRGGSAWWTRPPSARTRSACFAPCSWRPASS